MARLRAEGGADRNSHMLDMGTGSKGDWSAGLSLRPLCLRSCRRFLKRPRIQHWPSTAERTTGRGEALGPELSTTSFAVGFNAFHWRSLFSLFLFSSCHPAYSRRVPFVSAWFPAGSMNSTMNLSPCCGCPAWPWIGGQVRRRGDRYGPAAGRGRRGQEFS
jgi:hypothetical protein